MGSARKEHHGLRPSAGQPTEAVAQAIARHAADDRQVRGDADALGSERLARRAARRVRHNAVAPTMKRQPLVAGNWKVNGEAAQQAVPLSEAVNGMATSECGRFSQLGRWVAPL